MIFPRNCPCSVRQKQQRWGKHPSTGCLPKNYLKIADLSLPSYLQAVLLFRIFLIAYKTFLLPPIKQANFMQTKK